MNVTQADDKNVTDVEDTLDEYGARQVRAVEEYMTVMPDTENTLFHSTVEQFGGVNLVRFRVSVFGYVGCVFEVLVVGRE